MNRVIGSNRNICWLIVILIQIMDFTTTIIGLSIGYSEANPITKSILNNFGVVGFGVLKILGCAILCLATESRFSFFFANSFTFVAVLNNISLLLNFNTNEITNFIISILIWYILVRLVFKNEKTL